MMRKKKKKKKIKKKRRKIKKRKKIKKKTKKIKKRNPMLKKKTPMSNQNLIIIIIINSIFYQLILKIFLISLPNKIIVQIYGIYFLQPQYNHKIIIKNLIWLNKIIIKLNLPLKILAALISLILRYHKIKKDKINKIV